MDKLIYITFLEIFYIIYFNVTKSEQYQIGKRIKFYRKNNYIYFIFKNLIFSSDRPLVFQTQ